MKYLTIIFILNSLLMATESSFTNDFKDNLTKVYDPDPIGAAKGILEMIDGHVYSISKFEIKKYIKETLISDYTLAVKSGMQALGFYLDDVNIDSIKQEIDQRYKLNGFVIPYEKIKIEAKEILQNKNGKYGVLWICYDSDKNSDLIILTIVNKDKNIVLFDKFSKLIVE